MQTESRKLLKTVDISTYTPVLDTFEERLRQRNLAKSTIKNYVGYLTIFFAWCVAFLSSKAAILLDYDDFRAFFKFLEQDCRLMPRTINCYIATVKQFRYYIQKKDWNRYEIRFKKYDQTLPKVPSVEQAGMFVEACTTPLEFVLVMVLLSTGLRISEVCALTYGDIRRDSKQIYVRPGKGRSDRYVPLDDLVLEALEVYCKDINRIRLKAGLPKLRKDDPVFYFNDGIRPANKNFLTRVFGTVDSLAMQGKAHFTPHSCRHYFALQIYLQKYDLLLVKELLGHKSLNATEVYLRLAAALAVVVEDYTNPLRLAKKPTLAKQRKNGKKPGKDKKPNGKSDD